MRVFFDTNVLVAAYATHGACNDLLNHCLAHHVICTSGFVLKELADKLSRKIRLGPQETNSILDFLRRNCEIAADVTRPASICRDRDDDHVLGAAMNAHVDCIVSGDEDILVLKKIAGIPILQPCEFWRFETLE